MKDLSSKAAYGGEGWSPRKATHRDEIGGLWSGCGQVNEWGRLRSVLLHRPGSELEASRDPDAAQMLERIDPARAAGQHDAMADAYRKAGVAVQAVDPDGTPSPNLMFVADLMFTTPEGVILARPASTVRAGEERKVARRLADLGIPIVRTIRGNGTFEGADAAWINAETVLIGRGLRTNPEGAAQVAAAVRDMGAEAIQIDLPPGTMHMMGTLRIADRDLAIAWPGRFEDRGIRALKDRGFDVLFLPEGSEPERHGALNFVTLGPREILMTAGHPRHQTFYEEAGIRCRTVEVGELRKAAGGIGCLTGIVQRD